MGFTYQYEEDAADAEDAARELASAFIELDFHCAAQSGFSHPTTVHQDWIVYGGARVLRGLTP